MKKFVKILIIALVVMICAVTCSLAEDWCSLDDRLVQVQPYINAPWYQAKYDKDSIKCLPGKDSMSSIYTLKAIYINKKDPSEYATIEWHILVDLPSFELIRAQTYKAEAYKDYGKTKVGENDPANAPFFSVQELLIFDKQTASNYSSLARDVYRFLKKHAPR